MRLEPAITAGSERALSARALFAGNVALLAALLLGRLAMRGIDTYMFETGAYLCGPDLYNHERQVSLGLSPFFRAAFYAQFLSLLRAHFRELWFAVNLAAAFLTANLLGPALRRAGTNFPFVCALFASFALNFGGGQDASLMLLAVVSSLWLAAHGREGWAGAVLAVTLQKPSLYAPLILVPAARKQWRMVAGYAASAAALAAISLRTVGWQGIGHYFDSVGRYELFPYKMPTARGILANFSLPFAAALPFMCVAILAIVAVSRRSDFASALSFAVVASLFASPQSYGHDFAMLLLPAACFLYAKDSAMHWASAVLFLPPIHFLMLLPQPATALYGGVVGAYGVVLAWRSLSGALENTECQEAAGGVHSQPANISRSRLF